MSVATNRKRDASSLQASPAKAAQDARNWATPSSLSSCHHCLVLPSYDGPRAGKTSTSGRRVISFSIRISVTSYLLVSPGSLSGTSERWIAIATKHSTETSKATAGAYHSDLSCLPFACLVSHSVFGVATLRTIVDHIARLPEELRLTSISRRHFSVSSRKGYTPSW